MADLDKYKQAIVDVYDTTNKNIFVNATAGSGKTFTLCTLADRTPPIKSSIFLAFNKSIAQELGARLPRTVKASTLHSCSLSALLKAFKMDFAISENKYFGMARECLDFKGIAAKRINGLCGRACTLYDLMRFNLITDDFEKVTELGERYGVDADEESVQRALELYRVAKHKADRYFEGSVGGKLRMDFTDMLYYAANYIDMKDFKQYNVVMLDECLPYEIPVICENGQHLPIGKIVEEKLPVKVLTFNHETGEQEYKRVTNFSRTFNTKRCVKINAVQRKKHGERSFITCTFNHKIWVKDKGYIYAEEVQVGDIIQYETSAVKTQKYRVSPAGKHTLSAVMSDKNKDWGYIKKKRTPHEVKINRGGNGRINDLQNYFFSKLLGSWEIEGVVAMGKELSAKFHSPNHYKVDILNRELMVAIELDGESHNGAKRKDQDKRKDLVLQELGFKVIRIKNKVLLARFNEIVDAINAQNFDFCFNGIDCPIYLEVTNVTDMLLNEKYVYDITVEDNHNFYANGILVHNCQDISPLQFEVVKRCKTPRGRLIAVGDEKQSIYSFMGSNLDSLHAIKNSPNTIELPLSMTYRCAVNIVDEARKVFPDGIEAAPGAVLGSVDCGSFRDAKDGDFILCRNNAPLMETFIELLKLGKRCAIMGKDYGDELVYLIDSIKDIWGLEAKLEKLSESLAKKGVKMPTKVPAYAQLEEKVHVLLTLYEYFGDLEVVRNRIYDIFTDTQSKGVTLSTIHKSKGLEADNVYFLQPDLLPSKYAVTELALYAEKCLKFVAITRSRKNLIYC